MIIWLLVVLGLVYFIVGYWLLWFVEVQDETRERHMTLSRKHIEIAQNIWAEQHPQ